MAQTKTWQSYAYWVCLILLAVSIPLSKFTMSVFQFSLLGLWLWEGFSFRVGSRFFRNNNPFSASFYFLAYLIRLAAENLKESFKRIASNKTALMLISIYLLHIFWLFNTSNFDYALKDLRTKLPLLLLPVVLASIPKINEGELRWLLQFYFMAVFTATCISFFSYLNNDFTDIRQISLFISPIRFSLNIVFAIFIAAYLTYTYHKKKVFAWLISLTLIVWMVNFLLILESVTGVAILLIAFVLAGLMIAVRLSNLRVRIFVIITSIMVPLFMVMVIRNIVINAISPPDTDIQLLDQITSKGNPYAHDTINWGVEDGRYIGLYLCEQELRPAWNAVSEIDYDGEDLIGQEIRHTIVRYMTSKGLRKDAAGLSKLDKTDIHSIENGIANYNYIHGPRLKSRILKIITSFESYNKTRDPSGKSIIQRWEYWKASLGIISDNFWLGVGTGDVPEAFNAEYEKMQSKLRQDLRWRSHNQYLTIFIAFGVFGFLWFVVALFWPPLIQKAFSKFVYSVFFTIIILSMITEDTLETQDGVTLFAFFNSLLLLGVNWEASKAKPDDSLPS